MNDKLLDISDFQELNDQEEYGSYKKYTGIWDQPNALEVLLDVVGTDENIFKLTSPNFKKKSVWEEIAASVEEKGILLGDNRCRVAYQKWLNLKKTYVNHSNNKSEKTPHWFDKLHELIVKSDNKLLGNAGLQREDENKEDIDESPEKKMKQEYVHLEESGDNAIQNDPCQYVVQDISQVTYEDVVAIMQQLEVERREREEAREKKEKERFEKLAELLRQQNTLTEKLIAILSKPSTGIGAVDNHGELTLDPSVCIITTQDIHQ